MVSYFDEQVIRDIESRINIVDIASETIKLSRKGNRFWGLCPFHSEKTPSFSVSPERNMYYCFGCQSGGDLFNFVMKRDGLEFKEALQILAARAGVELPEARPSRDKDKRKRYVELNGIASIFFQKALAAPAGQAARLYLSKRNMSEDTIKKFELGFAPDSWNSLSEYLLKRGFSQEEIGGVGLSKRSAEHQRYFDLFRNRIMFPIHSFNGEVVGFGGRVLGDGFPKYLNTAETDIFQKRRQLFGLYQAKDGIRSEHEAIVVEGYMDCIQLQQAGISNAVATLGTALTQEQARILLRYAEKVLLIYDGDEAGQRQMERAIEVLNTEGLKVDVLTLPQGMDPDQFLAANGKEEFIQHIQNNRLSYIEYKINRQIINHPAQDIDSKIAVIRAVRDDIQGLESELQKDFYGRLLARKLALEENVTFRELKLDRSLNRKERASGNKTQLLRDNIIYGNYSNDEKILAACMVFPAVYSKLKDSLGLECFDNHDYQHLLKLFDQEADSEKTDMIVLRQRAEDKGLSSLLARITLLSDSMKIPPDHEVDDFINLVRSKSRQYQWNTIYDRLGKTRENGNFQVLLGFILNLDTFLHHAQEGGI